MGSVFIIIACHSSVQKWGQYSNRLTKTCVQSVCTNISFQCISMFTVLNTSTLLHVLIYFQTNPEQSQMLLMNSERFALLLANSLEVGATLEVASDNICKCYPWF